MNKSYLIASKIELAKKLEITLEELEKIGKETKKYYRRAELIQKNKTRELYIAQGKLKEIHQKINDSILDKIDFPVEINGGIKKRSRRMNASVHLEKTNVARFDIKDFYPSTKPKKVFHSFISIGIERNASKLLTVLVTADNHLPIGFSTSPKISALILTKLNKRIKNYLAKYDVQHSVWVDDVTISGKINLRRLKRSIKNFIQDEGYKLNNKTSFAYRNQPQVTTGINVNNDISAEKSKVEVVKNAIFVCGRFGIATYIKQYEPTMSEKNLKDVMSGRLGNLLSINKEKYRKLQKQWKLLLSKKSIV